jgi:hypothetical protein
MLVTVIATFALFVKRESVTMIQPAVTVITSAIETKNRIIVLSARAKDKI